MKGLILKDFYVFPLRFIFLIFCAACLVFKNIVTDFVNFEFLARIIMFFTVWDVFAGRIAEKGEGFDNTLPVTRAQIVSAKYIIVLCAHLLLVLLCAVGGIFVPGVGKWNSGEYLLLIVAGVMCGACAVLPMSKIFRHDRKEDLFGTAVYVMIINSAANIVWDVFKEQLFEDGVNLIGFICVIAAAAAMYAWSWLKAVKAYQKLDLR